MKIEIDQINTFEKINKVYTTQWMPIYKFIEEAYFKNMKTSRIIFMKY